MRRSFRPWIPTTPPAKAAIHSVARIRQRRVVRVRASAEEARALRVDPEPQKWRAPVLKSVRHKHSREMDPVPVADTRLRIWVRRMRAQGLRMRAEVLLQREVQEQES